MGIGALPAERSEAVRDLVLLGSTGSIGTQAIDVIRRAPERFRVAAVVAGGGDLGLLAEQAAELRVRAVGVSRAEAADELRARLASVWPSEVPQPTLVAGPHAAEELAACPA